MWILQRIQLERTLTHSFEGSGFMLSIQLYQPDYVEVSQIFQRRSRRWVTGQS